MHADNDPLADALEAALQDGITPPPALAPLLATAAELTRLPDALPPPSLALTQRVRRLTNAPAPRFALSPRRPAWALVLLLLLAALLSFMTVPGRRAVAGLLAALDLGNVRVDVAPAVPPTGAQYTIAHSETFASLQEAQAHVAYPLRTPAWLPPGYTLHSVSGITYAGMPDWFPQPLYVETVYHCPDSASPFDLTIRQFGVALGASGRISTLRFDAAGVSSTQEVQIGDRPALLVVFASPDQSIALHELVWRHDDVMIELLSQTLPPDDLIAIAVSLR